MDFADVFNAISEHMDGNWTIKGLVANPDLTRFSKQETEMKLFPIEYVNQRGCGDYGYWGTIYFPTTYSNGDGGVLYLEITFAD